MPKLRCRKNENDGDIHDIGPNHEGKKVQIMCMDVYQQRRTAGPIDYSRLSAEIPELQESGREMMQRKTGKYGKAASEAVNESSF